MPRTQDLENEVRVRLGNPPETELPSAQVTIAVTAALREFSRYRPRLASHTLALASGRAEYPLPAGAFGVHEIVPERMLYRTGMPWEVMPSGVDPAGVMLTEAEVALDPWNVMENSLRAARDDAGFLTEVLPPEEDAEGATPTLRLIPTPTRAARVKLVLEMEVEAATVARTDTELLLLYARAECLQFRGIKRNKTVWSIPTATGKLVLDTGEKFLALAAQMREEFDCKMGQGATVMIVG